MAHRLKFPEPFKHLHLPVKDVNQIIDEQKTFGQKVADIVAKNMGSWKFIIIQSIIFLFWVILNVTAYINHWDPYPFILMNLVLSLQAAYAAPVIMMSQNRQNERDRVEAKNDYLINQKAEEEVRAILDHLLAQNEALSSIHQILINHFPEEVGTNS
jgi:uncharacterized membrane protein